MNLRFLSPLLVFFLVLNLGCTPGKSRSKENSPDATPQEKGRIYPVVTCMKDHSFSYAVYLPKSYTPSIKWPVIIAFDPHASGLLPVEKYKDLAEKYGYIIMGSNDSKNGQDMNTSAIIMDAMMGETQLRYSIDTSRVCVMGFSGGARIAIILGFFMGGPSGVIGCGAGFPQTTQRAAYRPDFIAMVGNSDFNMTELVNLDKQLDELKFPHAFIMFNGIHDWPPTEVMEKGFIWNEFCAMRKNKIKKDNAMISTYIQSQQRVMENDKATGDALSLQAHLTNMIRFIDRLRSTDDYKRQLTAIESSAEYQLQKKQFQEVLDKETKEQQELNSNFFHKDIPWWKKKIASYDTRISRSHDSSEVRMVKRLKSWLSLISYMSYNRVLTAKDTSAAGHAMQIYELIDPENAAKTKAGNVK